MQWCKLLEVKVCSDCRLRIIGTVFTAMDEEIQLREMECG